MLREGKMDDRFVDMSDWIRRPMIEVSTPQGMEGMEFNLKEMFSNLMPKKTKKKTVKIPEALDILTQEEASKLVDMDKVTGEAMRRSSNRVSFFSMRSTNDTDVSAVQRIAADLCYMRSKYGMVKTDHILFHAP